MTMPRERTRAIRWGLELLAKFSFSNNLAPEQLEEVNRILQWYPNHAEIKAWAKKYESSTENAFQFLGIEDASNPLNDPVLPRGFAMPERREVSSRERFGALRLAIEVFEELLLSEVITREQADEVHYVLRHFPKLIELERWERAETEHGH